MATKRSVVEYFAEHEHYRCGYCGASDTNSSHGMWAHKMSVEDYQDLIDRGWRRSGMYVYKPTMNVTCCPQYPIRCEVNNFKISHSQKKVIKKVNRYLIKGIKAGGTCTKASGEMRIEQPKKSTPSGRLDAEETGLLKNTKSHIEQAANNKKDTVNTEHKKKTTPGVGADPNKPPCKKAKEIRLERKKQKIQMKSQDLSDADKSQMTDTSFQKKKSSEEKSLEDLLSEPEKVEDCAHKLEIKLVRSTPKSDELQKSYNNSYKVYRQYQISIHKDTPFECSESTFQDFLVKSPLQSNHPGGLLPMGYGSFHQHYIIDGKIVAVGVIDILPNCTSSVYLYYDPEYEFLSLGTYSALREVAFTRSLTKQDPNLIYYYMGFYIHSCPKMRYKGQYFPSFLLCPEVYSWHAIEECSIKLDKNKYSRFAEEGKEDENGKIELMNVLVLHVHEAMPYQIYRAFNSDAHDQKEVTEYAQFVGRKCAERMLLFRR